MRFFRYYLKSGEGWLYIRNFNQATNSKGYVPTFFRYYLKSGEGWLYIKNFNQATNSKGYVPSWFN
jgi:hypothetical protein